MPANRRCLKSGFGADASDAVADLVGRTRSFQQLVGPGAERDILSGSDRKAAKYGRD